MIAVKNQLIKLIFNVTSEVFYSKKKNTFNVVGLQTCGVFWASTVKINGLTVLLLLH